MNRTRHGIATVSTGVVTVVWVVAYTVALATTDHRPGAVSIVAQLVVPPLLWVAVLQIGWAVVGTRRALVRRRSPAAATDPPERLLAAMVALLPEDRREWGSAMLAELAGVRGRSARWRFARSSARATLLLPPAGGWPLLALVTGAAVTVVASIGHTVGAAVPGLGLFAVTFTGLLGALVVLAVARSHRPRLPLAVPTILVAAGTAAAIAATVVFLRREPTAAAHLPPLASVHLAAVLAGCLWLAVAPPRWLVASRLGPHLAAAAAIAFAGWFLLSNRTDGPGPSQPFLALFGAALALTPTAVLFVPAYVAGRSDRSFGAGLRAVVWTVTATMPMTYALWLPKALRRHAIDGRTLDGELIGPVGTNLTDALIFCFVILPMLGLALGAAGAALGARRTGGAARS
jgi:hypothetical protein